MLIRRVLPPSVLVLAALFFGAAAVTTPATAPALVSKRVVAFGTSFDAQSQVLQSQKLARELAKPDAPQWRTKGDQRRSYRFPDAAADIPYRLYVPTTWDGKANLPLVMMLHGAGGNENTYIDQNNKLMLKLAEQHGFLLVSPLGYNAMGAYGTCLRLPAVFGAADAAAQQKAALTPDKVRTLELSEKDVINVLQLVIHEYPVDPQAVFLTGHSMGSGGTWYLGGKYAEIWTAIAPMSGPFVDQATYPWDAIRKMPVFITEGTGATPSLAGSRKMRDWMKEQGFKMEYKEVNADHGGMVPLVLPDVFAFFTRCRGK